MIELNETHMRLLGLTREQLLFGRDGEPWQDMPGIGARRLSTIEQVWLSDLKRRGLITGGLAPELTSLGAAVQAGTGSVGEGSSVGCSR